MESLLFRVIVGVGVIPTPPMEKARINRGQLLLATAAAIVKRRANDFFDWGR